jgi:hypothetical protein
MKRVKIMLLSSLVVAAVAGGIAFKAKTVSPGLFCGDSPISCPTPTDDAYEFTNVNPLPGIYCTDIETQTTTCERVKFED